MNTVAPSSVGILFQGPQWKPETVDTIESYIYYVFSYTHIPMIEFNLQISHSKRLATNYKINQSI